MQARYLVITPLAAGPCRDAGTLPSLVITLTCRATPRCVRGSCSLLITPTSTHQASWSAAALWRLCDHPPNVRFAAPNPNHNPHTDSDPNPNRNPNPNPNSNPNQVLRRACVEQRLQGHAAMQARYLVITPLAAGPRCDAGTLPSYHPSSCRATPRCRHVT